VLLGADRVAEWTDWVEWTEETVVLLEPVGTALTELAVEESVGVAEAAAGVVEA
jgi:hypothetical protein